jgi:hypothetical protein
VTRVRPDDARFAASCSPVIARVVGYAGAAAQVPRAGEAWPSYAVWRRIAAFSGLPETFVGRQ